MIEHKKLENAIANNLDGYGLVLSDRDSKILEVVRNYNPDGTDDDVVARLLEDNKGVTRHLHLRNNTKGANNLDNTHPFSVFSTVDRKILLMHNGTFANEFCPKVGDLRSDTRIFGEDFLSPLLHRFTGEFGLGDYNDPILKSVISRFAGGHNRVMLMSNDLEPLRLGTWHTITNEDGSKFEASNNDYFGYITRGPRKPPFQHQTQTHYGHNRAPYGTGNLGTTTVTTGNNVVPIKQQEVASSDTTFRDLEDGKTFKQESIATEGKTNALPSKPIVPLSSVDQSKQEFSPTNPFLLSLGSSSKMFQDFGLDSIAWISDAELESAIRSGHVSDLADLLRTLVEVSQGAAEESDVSGQLIERYKRDHDALEETVTMLEREVETLTLRLADCDDQEETNRSLSLDNKLLKKQNEQMAYEVDYLRNAMRVAEIMVPSSDAIRTIAKDEKKELAA